MSLAAGAFLLALAIVYAIVVGYILIVGIPQTCDRCGGKYKLGKIDKHFANDCTPYERSIWNGRKR